ncbi:Uncharacterized protein EbC_pEb17200240 (plasmid) [Erwinia billingiae Eb661]|uniref:Uncharacterized protein n=1 Tax=Erwinia billingiae (strain Eb661) TaxID=634500 RepID=D8MJM9_ERWBE|nr:Uncharacterized protein EbC_pEb17200240 [Erwinia billingiae Eb661]
MRKAEMYVQACGSRCHEIKRSTAIPSCKYQEFRQHSPCDEQTSSKQAVNVHNCILPFRFAGLPIKRKLIRMMLLLEREQLQSEKHSTAGTSFSLVKDYIYSLMNTAVSRGELRYRPPEEMVGCYLSLTEELSAACTTSRSRYVCLRREVRRRIEIFLEKYAAGGGL